MNPVSSFQSSQQYLDLDKVSPYDDNFDPKFWTAKDHELHQAVKGYESQLLQATQALAEYKHRAITAEVRFRSLTLKFPELIVLF